LVNINETSNYWDQLAPFGGAGRSGVGREQEERCTALGRLGESRQSVGQPRALVHGAHTDGVGYAGVRVGHGDGTAFVPRRHKRASTGNQGIGHREVAAAYQPKDVMHTKATKRIRDHLCNIHPRSLKTRQAPGLVSGCRTHR